MFLVELRLRACEEGKPVALDTIIGLTVTFPLRWNWSHSFVIEAF